MAGYDTAQYLLDQANIRDIIEKIVLAYDLKSSAMIRDEIYSPKCIIDYSAIMGGGPTSTTSAKWAEGLLEMLGGMTATQHVVAGVVTHLPQPGPSTSRPERAESIANGHATLVMPGPDGKDITVRNGGRYELEVVRSEELERKGENPWRVARHKMIALWSEPPMPPQAAEAMGAIMEKMAE